MIRFNIDNDVNLAFFLRDEIYFGEPDRRLENFIIIISPLLEYLPEDNRKAVEWRLGINTKQHTFKEMGIKANRSLERCRQRYARGIRKLNALNREHSKNG